MTLSPTSKLNVFLCHASEDKATVRQLYFRLKNDFFSPWLDEEDILPGQNWDLSITEAVQKADVVLVCLSHKSVNKAGYIQKEIRYVLDRADEQPERAIFVIPVKLEECDVPVRLRQWQWVNYFGPDGYERLLNALGRRCLDLGMDTPSLEKAPISNISNILNTLRNGLAANKILTWSEFTWLSDFRNDLLPLLVEQELAFALRCALQHGKNLPFWCRANRDNPYAIESVAAPLIENFGRRPLLRAGFALEQLNNTLGKETIAMLSPHADRLKDIGNDVPLRVIKAAEERKTLHLWKDELLTDTTYGPVIKQLLHEVSEEI